jgi:hypothetical protein
MYYETKRRNYPLKIILKDDCLIVMMFLLMLVINELSFSYDVLINVCINGLIDDLIDVSY